MQAISTELAAEREQLTTTRTQAGAGAAGNAGNIMALDIGSKVFKLYDR